MTTALVRWQMGRSDLMEGAVTLEMLRSLLQVLASAADMFLASSSAMTSSSNAGDAWSSSAGASRGAGPPAGDPARLAWLQTSPNASISPAAAWQLKGSRSPVPYKIPLLLLRCCYFAHSLVRVLKRHLSCPLSKNDSLTRQGHWADEAGMQGSTWGWGIHGIH